MRLTVGAVAGLAARGDRPAAVELLARARDDDVDTGARRGLGAGDGRRDVGAERVHGLGARVLLVGQPEAEDDVGLAALSPCTVDTATQRGSAGREYDVLVTGTPTVARASTSPRSPGWCGTAS